VTFVDTGAWVALFVEVDVHYLSAQQWLDSNHDRLVTSDYVVDEVLTLINARYRKADGGSGRTSAVWQAPRGIGLPNGRRHRAGVEDLWVAQRQAMELHGLHEFRVDAKTGNLERVCV